MGCGLCGAVLSAEFILVQKLEASVCCFALAFTVHQRGSKRDSELHWSWSRATGTPGKSYSLFICPPSVVVKII